MPPPQDVGTRCQSSPSLLCSMCLVDGASDMLTVHVRKLRKQFTSGGIDDGKTCSRGIPVRLKGEFLKPFGMLQMLLKCRREHDCVFLPTFRCHDRSSVVRNAGAMVRTLLRLLLQSDALLQSDDCLDLDLGAFRQGLHFIASARRKRCRKIAGIDMVDLRKVAEVGEKHGRLHGFGQFSARGLSNRCKILQALFGLLDGVCGVELARRRIDRQLPGDEDEIANLDGL